MLRRPLSQNVQSYDSHPTVRQLGTQQRADWRSDESAIEKPVVDLLVQVPGQLHRVAVTGRNVRLRIVWGTGASFQIDDLLSPMSCDFAGFVQVYARKLNEDLTAYAIPSIAKVSGTGPCVVRRFLDGAQSVGEFAAGIVNPGGAPLVYTVPSGADITIPDDPAATGRVWPIEGGASIVSGRAFVDYAW